MGSGLRPLKWFFCLLSCAGFVYTWVPGPLLGTAGAQSLAASTLSGTVADPTGALVPQAQVRLSGPAGEQTAATDALGRYSFNTAPGQYTVSVQALGFAKYTSPKLTLSAGTPLRLPVRLVVAGVAEVLDVGNGTADTGDGGSALTFEGDRLKALSDDNGTLLLQLNALAGPSLGGGGAQILVNGFSGGRLPPKSSIRSIRINTNPFSAYYDQPGFGRIEIQTRPGTDKLHGDLNFGGTDQPFNARNPYTGAQPPFYQFQTDGDLNGPLNKKTSFFVSENVQQLANNAVVNAVVLDPSTFDTTPLSQALPAPQLTQTYALRLDRQFNPNNFAFLRNEWSQTHTTNNGINPLILPAAAFTSNTLTDTLQASDTQIFGAHAVNEGRFQYLRTRTRQDPNSTAPAVLVEGAFQDGGNPLQALRDNQDRYELQDLFELDHGTHSVRTGLRLRALREANDSSANFNGEYIFTDIGSYQAAARALASSPAGTGVAGAAQFALTTGQPNALLYTDDFAVFAEDDWRATKNLSLNYGFRAESQSAVPQHFNPAPRLGAAWSLHRGKSPAPFLTLRAGYGIFYDRFPAANLLQAVRQNGTSEVAYFQQNPTTFPYLPVPATLGATQPTLYRVDPGLRTSYIQLGSFTVLKPVRSIGVVAANFVYVHGSHEYLTRNSNAPLPGTFNPADANSGTRPLGTTQNIYQYTSASNENEEILTLSANLQVTPKLYVYSVYTTQQQRADADASTNFAADPYNLRADYGRRAGIFKQTLFAGAVWKLPRGFQLQPFLNFHSGSPFDITTGTDLNGDTIYNDRPSFATDLSRASVVRTRYGNFDTAPLAGQTPIPRNYATAPAFFWLDLQASRTFHIGPRPQAAAAAGAPSARPDRPWELRFQVEAENATNRNNPGIPIGVLTSPDFGHALSLAHDFNPLSSSNRTLLLQSFFSF